ncbi:MAG: DUF1799 domain-containing protein [Rhodoferax sp.]|nr:DUF1799 domain-containing protein [Rhodoferax sp.]MDP3651047.1 DUF1799 domain-containing protein [Rhodoferax sp.]
MWRQGKKLAQVARIQARGQLYIPGARDEPDAEFDEALAAFGFQQAEEDPDAPPPDKCHLWPCNVAAFNVWQRLQTQWRESAMGGRTGLDYASVTGYLRDVLGIKPKERIALFGCIQAMEIAALEEWAKQKT